MKAVFVVDINDNVDVKDIEDFLHNVFLNNVLSSKVSLKLLPKKKRPFGSEWENKYVEGFNDCIDEILGE